MSAWYFWTVLGWLLLALPTFLILLKIKAPFGRHTTRGWGPLIPNRIAWFLMELPALILLPLLAFSGNPDNITLFFVCLWLAHYFNRACIFPLRIRTVGKKMPLTIMLMALSFNLINGFLCGYYFANYASYDASHLYQPYVLLGLLLFGGGAFLNIYSDNILIHLRKKQETSYVIPMQGPFRYVSCPNLLGEMIEWIGFALMTAAFPCWAFAVWTIANLLPRAIAHHRWYQQRFMDYPPQRRATIPFIL